MVLVFAESNNGQFKKSAFEVVTFGAKTAEKLGTQCVALTLGSVQDAGQLGKYGASKVYNLANDTLNTFDSQVYSSVIAETALKLGAKLIIVPFSPYGKALTGRLSVKLNAGSVSAVIALPEIDGNTFMVKRDTYSAKAITDYEIKSEYKILSVKGNSIAPEELGSAVSVENPDITVPQPKITVKEVNTIKGAIPLPEAERVVSGGRGMKGPENWGVLEDLANALNASIACSRPVADDGWRPHHEHVGQTGGVIAPNLYVALGISGAIQHLAGVNKSKVIVVINKDPEAPFFKAADYGVVGDLFEVVPKLTEAIKKIKG